MSIALLGLGSNLTDRLSHINHAIESLQRLPGTKVLQVSHLYETVPVEYSDQPLFLNAVVKIDTTLSASALLGCCLGIEAGLGRVRTIKNGPRIIDIDLLIYDGVKSDTYELTLPHPRMGERAFVLAPLLDLYPGGRAPMFSFSHKLKNIGLDGITKIEQEVDFNQ